MLVSSLYIKNSEKSPVDMLQKKGPGFPGSPSLILLLFAGLRFVQTPINADPKKRGSTYIQNARKKMLKIKPPTSLHRFVRFIFVTLVCPFPQISRKLFISLEETSASVNCHFEATH
jgi:hypothetical protein